MCKRRGVMSPELVRGGKRITHMNEHEEVAEAVSNLPAVPAPDMTELAEQLVAAAAEKGLDLTGEGGC